MEKPELPLTVMTYGIALGRCRPEDSLRITATPQQDNLRAYPKSYQYDAFGGILKESGDIQNRIMYTGQMYDGALVQYYLRARYYNPKIGRFMQEDTYRGDGLNLYAYCQSNPVKYYDSGGYMSFCPNMGTPNTKNLSDFIPDQIEGPNGTIISKEYDELVYGGFYSRETYNRMRYEANAGDYTKHTKALTENQAIHLSYDQAQYMPGINNTGLEYEAMFNGIPVKYDNSTVYYFYDTGMTVGYDQGMPTTWIHSELTSGTYHGHPMNVDRVKKYLGY